MRQTRWICVLLGLLFLFGGCASGVSEDGNTYYLYSLNETESKIESEEIIVDLTDTKTQIEEMIDRLNEHEAPSGMTALLPKDVKILDYQVGGESLILDLSARYESMDVTREVLTRAGLVRTFTQLSDVNTLTIRVDGKALTDRAGKTYGAMTQEMFVENEGQEINSYQYVTLTLYFANHDGSNLVSETRKIYSSTNVPIEKTVLEQLVKGPTSKDLQATIPPETAILDVSVAENICYVNLDRVFSDQTLNVEEEMPIYSIVNSIIDSCSNVSEVQIAVEGETNLIFREDIDLNQFFKKDISCIETVKE